MSIKKTFIEHYSKKKSRQYLQKITASLEFDSGNDSRFKLIVFRTLKKVLFYYVLNQGNGTIWQK